MKVVDYIFIGIASGIMNIVASLPDDASSVTWAHAVNDKKKLEDALAGEVQFLEADVSLGNVTGPIPEIMVPIMAHPPDNISDISLSNWIKEVISANRNKGVKLDFKFLEIVEPSLKILQELKEKITFPLWLNADILPGPVDSTTVPVNDTQFLSLCQQYFPQSTLSVGWTTNYQGIPGNYNWNNVKDMAESLQCSNVNQLVTFPIRAIFVGASLSQLLWLLDTFPSSTLTIWSGIIDPVIVDDLLKLRSLTEFSRVYYDLPAQLNQQFQDKKGDIEPVVRLPGFNNRSYTIFGEEETCTNKAYITSSDIMFTGEQKGIIFHEIFCHRESIQINGKINFLINSSLAINTSLHLFISKANAFPQHPNSSGYISIPSSIDVFEVVQTSAMFSHRFSNNLINQQFQLHFSKNSGTLNIMHNIGEKQVTTTHNFNYNVDAVISFISEGGPSVIYDGEFIRSDVSSTSNISANLFLLIALFMLLYSLKI